MLWGNEPTAVPPPWGTPYPNSGISPTPNVTQCGVGTLGEGTLWVVLGGWGVEGGTQQPRVKAVPVGDSCNGAGSGYGDISSTFPPGVGGSGPVPWGSHGDWGGEEG